MLLAVTVAVPTFSGGGFDTSSRSVFVALAGAALLAACMIDGRAVVQASRAPLALTLVALALLSLASVAWTIGSRTAAMRWGLVIGGYAAVFIAAATFAQAGGPWPIAAGIAALALIEAILGLRAVAFHALPDAERIGQTWRPGGTFEYPPALAILEVGALPVLSHALARARAPVAGGAAASATLAGAVLGIASSRLALALAATLLLALILRPQTDRCARAAAIATAALVLIGGLLGAVVLGGSVGPAAPGSGTAGAAEIAALSVAACGGWLLVRRASRVGERRWAVATACVIALALAFFLAAGGGNSQRPRQHSPAFGSAQTGQGTDFLHGRAHEWVAAIETWLDRPWLGAGADAYYTAARPHQAVPRLRFAHDLTLELAAELGILGLLLGIALYASGAWTISQAIHSRALWLLAPTVLVFLVSNLVDWTWHLAGLGSIWAASSGALHAAKD